MNGPISFEELVNLISMGVITQQTFVWQTGQMRQMAGNVEALIPYFQYTLNPNNQPFNQPPQQWSMPQSVLVPPLNQQSMQQSLQQQPWDQPPMQQPPEETPPPEKKSNVLLDTFYESTGVGRMEGFSLSELFSETFTKHSDEDLERYFGVGTPDTTPSINNVKVAWPKPWVFVRLIALGLIGYYLMWLGISVFHNSNCLPGAIIFGAFVIPMAGVMFFYESNILKNVSLYMVGKLFLYGGCFGFIIALTGFLLIPVLNSILQASSAGLIEEPAKLLVLILLLKFGRLKHKNYILNGLLFGAAVGAGFAAFESAGYAFNSYQTTYMQGQNTVFSILIANTNTDQKVQQLQTTFNVHNLQDIDQAIEDRSQQDMTHNLYIRGVLAPFGHIIWTAMCAGALWRVKKNQDFKMYMLSNPLFLTVIAIAVALHMAWNSSLVYTFTLGYHFYILGIIGWVVIFGLIGMGLRQVHQQQQYLANKEAQKQQTA